MKTLLLLSSIALFGVAAPEARAFWFFNSQSSPLLVFNLAIKGRSFLPKELSVPAGEKFKLIVSNENLDSSEFESFSLHREQVITSHSKITIFLGPLKSGKYDFFDDFHSGVNGIIKAVPRATGKSK